MTDTPTFLLWSHETLAKYAMDQYLDNQQLREAIEQLRLDNKDLSKLARLNLFQQTDDLK